MAATTMVSATSWAGGGEEERRSGELGRRDRAADGADRHRALHGGAYQVVGELLAGQALVVLGERVQVPDRDAGRDVEEDVGQPSAAASAGLPGSRRAHGKRACESAEQFAPLGRFELTRLGEPAHEFADLLTGVGGLVF
ncbi:hypothetical protein ACFSTC_14805 [Nonomuraea ferruginea]